MSAPESPLQTLIRWIRRRLWCPLGYHRETAGSIQAPSGLWFTILVCRDCPATLKGPINAHLGWP